MREVGFPPLSVLRDSPGETGGTLDREARRGTRWGRTQREGMPEDVGRTSETEAPVRRRRPPLVTRDQVIDKAYQLVDDEGPKGLSMRRLANALHVSLPTVYTAIDSREALV